MQICQHDKSAQLRRKGFEPLTPWFVAKYSIQLSYRRIRRERDLNPWYDLSYTPLAGERLRPLGHLSTSKQQIDCTIVSKEMQAFSLNFFRNFSRNILKKHMATIYNLCRLNLSFPNFIFKHFFQAEFIADEHACHRAGQRTAIFDAVAQVIHFNIRRERI